MNRDPSKQQAGVFAGNIVTIDVQRAAASTRGTLWNVLLPTEYRRLCPVRGEKARAVPVKELNTMTGAVSMDSRG